MSSIDTGSQLACSVKNTNYQGKYLTTPEEVDFNVDNLDHCIAYVMLSRPVAKQHPTLRFKIDPAIHDSVIHMMREKLIEAQTNKALDALEKRKPSPLQNIRTLRKPHAT